MPPPGPLTLQPDAGSLITGGVARVELYAVQQLVASGAQSEPRRPRIEGSLGPSSSGTSRPGVVFAGEDASVGLCDDDPRPLGTNAAGTDVSAVMLKSGNQSKERFDDLMRTGRGPPSPNPPRSAALGTAPAVGSSSSGWHRASLRY